MPTARMLARALLRAMGRIHLATLNPKSGITV
jgi:hypothetical protein